MTSPFLKVLCGEIPPRPPVWFMRQAGRCLPEYLELKKKYSFFELMNDPELASRITLMPVEKLNVDAAIVFSDILIIVEALGIKIDYEKGKPIICNPIGTTTENYIDGVPSLPKKRNPEVLSRTYKTLAMVKKKSNVPLIGFCGGPLTVFFYLFEGSGDQFHQAKQFLYSHPKKSREILKEITECSIAYALGQTEQNIDAFQIFESWAGSIPYELYREIVLPEVIRLANAIEKKIPVVFFPRGLGKGYDDLPKKLCSVIGIDQFTPLSSMAKTMGNTQILQGNFDPYLPLAMSDEDLKKTIIKSLDFFHQHPKWIVNLGHGVLPSTNWKKLKIIVDCIRNFS